MQLVVGQKFVETACLCVVCSSQQVYRSFKALKMMRKRYFPTQTVPWPQWWGQYMLRPVWYPRKQGRVLWDIAVPYHWVLYTETINSTMTMISQIYTYVTLFMQTHIAKTELCLVSQAYPTIDCTQRWMSLIFWLLPLEFLARDRPDWNAVYSCEHSRSGDWDWDCISLQIPGCPSQ